MNRLYSTFLVLLVIVYSAMGQTSFPKIEQGKVFDSAELGSGQLFSDKNGILDIRWLGKKLSIKKFGSDLTLQKIMQYDGFPKDFQPEKILRLSGKCYLLYSVEVEKKWSMYVAQIDVAKGELIDAGKEIVTSSGDISVEPSTGKGFKIIVAPDASYFAICYSLKSITFSKSKIYETTGVWVFNNQLNERWHSEFQLPYTKKKCNVRGRSIDTNGNIHLVLTVINDESGLEKRYGQDTPNYSLEVLSYKSPTVTPKIRTFNLKGKFLHSFSINGDSTNLICSGLYESGLTSSGPEGIFIVKLLPDSDNQANLHPFKLDLVNEGEKKLKQKANENKTAKGKPLNIDDLSLVSTILQVDGGILLQGEEQTAGRSGYYVQSSTPGSAAGGYSTGGTSPTRDNIIVAKFLPDGSLSWIKKLLKEQTSSSANPIYKYSRPTINSHYFFFVEDDELIQVKIDDQTGECERKMLLQFKPLLKKPQVFYTISEQLALIPEGNGVVFEAFLSGDRGTFGESKPFKEEMLIRVTVD